jgi:hypothetical protein
MKVLSTCFRHLAVQWKLLIALGVLTAIVFSWYRYSVPKLYPGSINSIKQIRLPLPSILDGHTGVVEVRDEHTIRQYVEVFNALDLKPASVQRQPFSKSELRSTGFHARNKIQLKWGFVYDIQFLSSGVLSNGSILLLDGQMAVAINGRYFVMGRNSYIQLIDIMSDYGMMIHLSQY